MASDFTTQGPLKEYAFIPLEIIQGVSLNLKVSLTYINEAGTEEPYNLSGCKLFFACRKTADSEDADIEKSTEENSIETTSALEGMVSIPFLPADTLNLVAGKYIYEILVESADLKRYIPVRGSIKILRSVVRPPVGGSP